MKTISSALAPKFLFPLVLVLVQCQGKNLNYWSNPSREAHTTHRQYVASNDIIIMSADAAIVTKKLMLSQSGAVHTEFFTD